MREDTDFKKREAEIKKRREATKAVQKKIEQLLEHTDHSENKPARPRPLQSGEKE